MIKKNIGLLSLGCNGTAGHVSLLNSLTKHLNSKTHFNLFIYSENPPKPNKKNIFLRKLNKQDVNSTVAGCLNYKSGNELIKKIKKDKINILIISTFFDKEIIKKLKKEGIKTILINYPLRDTHKQAFLLKKYYNCFTSVYTLKGLQKINKTFPNESILSPIRPEIKIKKIKNKKFNILVTCGGGGLSSSTKFFELINYLIEEFS